MLHTLQLLKRSFEILVVSRFEGQDLARGLHATKNNDKAQADFLRDNVAGIEQYLKGLDKTPDSKISVNEAGADKGTVFNLLKSLNLHDVKNHNTAVAISEIISAIKWNTVAKQRVTAESKSKRREVQGGTSNTITDKNGTVYTRAQLEAMTGSAGAQDLLAKMNAQGGEASHKITSTSRQMKGAEVQSGRIAPIEGTGRWGQVTDKDLFRYLAENNMRTLEFDKKSGKNIQKFTDQGHKDFRKAVENLGVKMDIDFKAKAKWERSFARVDPNPKINERARVLIQDLTDSGHWLNNTDTRETPKGYKKNPAAANDALNKMSQNFNSFDQAWKDNADIARAIQDYCYDNNRGGLDKLIRGGWNLRNSLSTLNALGLNGNPAKMNLLTNEIATLAWIKAVTGRGKAVSEIVTTAVIGYLVSGGTSVSLYLANIRFKGRAQLLRNLDAGKVQDITQWLKSGAQTPRPVYKEYKWGYQGSKLTEMGQNINTVAHNGSAEQKEQAKNTVSNTVDSFLQSKWIPDLRSLQGLFSRYHNWRSPEAPRQLQKHINNINTLSSNTTTQDTREATIEAKKAYYIVYKEAFRETVNSLGLGNVLRSSKATYLMKDYFRADLKDIKGLFTPEQLTKIHTRISDRTVLGCLGQNISTISSFYQDAMNTLNSQPKAKKVADRFAGLAGDIRDKILKHEGKNANLSEHWAKYARAEIGADYDLVDHSVSKAQRDEVYQKMKSYGMCDGIEKQCYMSVPVVISISTWGPDKTKTPTEPDQPVTNPVETPVDPTPDVIKTTPTQNPVDLNPNTPTPIKTQPTTPATPSTTQPLPNNTNPSVQVPAQAPTPATPAVTQPLPNNPFPQIN